jgi:hypothetical protein
MRLTCALRRMVLTICHSERSEESYQYASKLLAKHTSCRKRAQDDKRAVILNEVKNLIGL